MNYRTRKRDLQNLLQNISLQQHTTHVSKNKPRRDDADCQKISHMETWTWSTSIGGARPWWQKGARGRDTDMKHLCWSELGHGDRGVQGAETWTWSTCVGPSMAMVTEGCTGPEAGRTLMEPQVEGTCLILIEPQQLPWGLRQDEEQLDSLLGIHTSLFSHSRPECTGNTSTCRWW